MPDYKSLVKDTAIYGVSSIVGRFLNYLLVPIHTGQITAASGGYGVITNMYSWTALLLIILTFGMETTFFYYARRREDAADRVFSTAFLFVTMLSALFLVLVFTFLSPIADFFKYADHPQYVWVMAVVVSLDAVTAVPFTYLRQQKKAIRFATLKMVNILLSITLTLIYYKGLDGHDPGYAFYINLVCSAVVALLVYKEISVVAHHGFDWRLCREMLGYTWPIVIFGIAGILNQVADKILFPFVYTGDDMRQQLGIYGAVVKIAMIMAMVQQAFKYAYEPHVFNIADSRESDRTQAGTMKYYIIFMLLGFLFVVAWLDVLKVTFIHDPDYYVGIDVVPVVMAAELMMGIYTNLSFWYKLENKTIWGAVFSIPGCLVLVVINVLLVPKIGYWACAWGGFAGYFTSMTLSYFVGRHYHPIAYPLRDIGLYVMLAAVAFAAMMWVRASLPMGTAVAVNSLFVAAFIAVIIRRDLPLSSLPVIGKYFRRKAS